MTTTTIYDWQVRLPSELWRWEGEWAIDRSGAVAPDAPGTDGGGWESCPRKSKGKPGLVGGGVCDGDGPGGEAGIGGAVGGRGGGDVAGSGGFGRGGGGGSGGGIGYGWFL